MNIKLEALEAYRVAQDEGMTAVELLEPDPLLQRLVIGALQELDQDVIDEWVIDAHLSRAAAKANDGVSFDVVADASELSATEINNQGKGAQSQFLVGALGCRAVAEMIEALGTDAPRLRM